LPTLDELAECAREPLRITRRSVPGTAHVLDVRGSIDLATCDRFEDALTSALHTCSTGGVGLVVDLTGLDHIAVCGLRSLAEVEQRAAAQGVRLWVVAPHAHVVVRLTALVMPLATLTHDTVDTLVRRTTSL
jgi:anti-anti-sigma factor